MSDRKRTTPRAVLFISANLAIVGLYYAFTSTSPIGTGQMDVLVGRAEKVSCEKPRNHLALYVDNQKRPSSRAADKIEAQIAECERNNPIAAAEDDKAGADALFPAITTLPSAAAPDSNSGLAPAIEPDSPSPPSDGLN